MATGDQKPDLKKEVQIPKISRWLLERLSTQYASGATLGDLEEEFEVRVEEGGPRRARAWYRRQVVKSVLPNMRHAGFIGGAMVLNYLKTALRYLRKNKLLSFINITGLAVGLACTSLILLWIRYEWSFDRFHENADQFYRVSVRWIKAGQVEYDGPVFVAPLGPALESTFPEVESAARFSTEREGFLTVGETSLYFEDVYHTDPEFLDLFTFPLIAGDPAAGLSEPYSMIVTEASAQRLFGNADVIGEMVTYDGGLYRITGLAENPPRNSHIQFDVLISFSTLYEDPRMYMDWNGGNQYLTYIRLAEGADSKTLESKFPDLMWRVLDEDFADIKISHELYLEPFSDIHLKYHYDSDALRRRMAVFLFIAGLILVVACINFINLTTAHASKRGKEVGVRKALGAGRSVLFRQFVGETMALSFLAFLVSILVLQFMLPVFSGVVGRELSLFQGGAFQWLVWAGMILLVGGIAGVYPSLVLSRFSSTRVLKGETGREGGKAVLRNVLIVFQFTVSIALIVCTLLIQDQIRFLRGKDLGFERENMLILPLVDESHQSRAEVLKQELLRIPGIGAVTATSDIPSHRFTRNGYFVEGVETVMMIHALHVDEDFFQAYGIPVVEGRAFSDAFGTDKQAYMINTTLARMLDWQNPLGKTIKRNGEHTVIGMVEDFNFASLHRDVGPLILTHHPSRGLFEYLSVRIQTAEIRNILKAVQRVWDGFAPGTPFSYSFLDDRLDDLYRSEERFGHVFLYYAGLSILIALLGLFSLAAYAAEQRTKEIGIRKVLGASVSNVVFMLSNTCLRWVVIANVLAWPAAFFVMSRWLRDFAYRISIGVGPFLLAGGLVLVFAFTTIGWKAFKAARANPVDSLRYE